MSPGWRSLLLWATSFSTACGRVGFEPSVPELALSTPAFVLNALDTATFGGICRTGLSVQVEDPTPVVIPCRRSAWTYSVRAQSTDGVRDYRFTTTSRGRTMEASGRWQRDTAPPVLRPLSFVLAEAEAGGVVRRQLVHAALGGDDASDIVAVCLSWRAAVAPPAGDVCWIRLGSIALDHPPGPSITLTDLPVSLGFTAGPYTLRAWLMDELGHISPTTNTSQTDLLALDLQPAPPPKVTVLLVANSEAPGDPLTDADLDLTNGPFYVKWRADDDGTGWSAGPISLSWSASDRDYQPLAVGLANGDNGCLADSIATTADDGATGCFLVAGGVPTAEPFHLRVTATNSVGLIGSGSSALLNGGATRLLAGTIDPGLEAGARDAFFRATESANVYLDESILAVTASGDLYFRDPSIGVLRVSAVDGRVGIFLPHTWVHGGDGGPVTGATARYVSRLLADHQDRLLLWDAGRIRRVDTHAVPMTIDTLIGGGDSTEDGVSARDASLPEQVSAWFVLPNGDIYFQENGGRTVVEGYRIRRYDAARDVITSVIPQGAGDSLSATQEIAACGLDRLAAAFDPGDSELAFFYLGVFHDSPACPEVGAMRDAAVLLDPTTGSVLSSPVSGLSFWASNFVGMDGRLRAATRNGVFAFEPSSATWTRIIGVDQGGSTADGVAALEAALRIDDVFVTRDGVVYLVDRTRIRVVDEGGRVQTVAGQTPSSADRIRAQDARFQAVYSLRSWNDGSRDRVLALDQLAGTLHELTDGGRIELLAGGRDGTPESNLAVTQPLSVVASGSPWDIFAVHATTGDVFFNRGGDSVSRLDRASGEWVHLVGGGATPYNDAASEGLPGSAIDLTPGTGLFYYPLVLGAHDTAVLVSQGWWRDSASGMQDTFLNEHDIVDGTRNHVVGTVGATSNDFCANGTSLTSCAAPAHSTYTMTNATYLPNARRWAVSRHGATRIWSVAPGDSMQTLVDPLHPLGSFAVDETANRVHYCATNGSLHTIHLAGGSTDDHSLPIGLICRGHSLLLTSTGDALIFPCVYNGFSGVARFALP